MKSQALSETVRPTNVGPATSRRSLNICLIVEGFPPVTGGGIATYAYVLAKGMAKLGHKVHVITRGWAGDTVEDSGGVRVYRVSIPEPSWRRGTYFVNLRFAETRQIVLWNFRVSQVLHDILASGPLDVIESQEYHAPALLTAMRRYRVPIVVRLHSPSYLCRQISGISTGTSKWDTTISERLEYYMARCAHAVTSPSRQMADSVSQQWHLSSDAVKIIPYPIDEDFFCPAESPATADPTLLYVGRLSRIKGVETLVEALPAILRSFPQIRVRLVGKDHSAGSNGSSMRAWLCQRATDLGVPPATIDFTGRLERNTLPATYRDAAVCIIPSFHESFSYSCVEAMASGCAVVASAVGELPEIVKDKENGLLVPPGSPQALAEAVTRLLSDSQLRHQLGQRARATVCERFSSNVICKEMERIYRSLLN